MGKLKLQKSKQSRMTLKEAILGAAEEIGGPESLLGKILPTLRSRHVYGPMLPAVQMVICSIASSVRSNARVRPGRRTIRA
jgi:hypothetical protein